jgi:hypothetical protein
MQLTKTRGLSGWIRPALTVLAAAAITSAAAGCKQPPRGDPGGRADPYSWTESDVHSDAAGLPALLEFSDATADALARDLAALEQLETQGDEKLVLELGSLENRTNSTPTQDFELIQNRLRSKLMNSPILREKFRFVESRRAADAELGRVAGPEEAARQGGRTARYAAEDTFVLQGDFFEARRGGGGRRQYFFEFALVNLATRERVFSEGYDLAQVRDEDALRDARRGR